MMKRLAAIAAASALAGAALFGAGPAPASAGNSWEAHPGTAVQAAGNSWELHGNSWELHGNSWELHGNSWE